MKEEEKKIELKFNFRDNKDRNSCSYVFYCKCKQTTKIKKTSMCLCIFLF